MCIRGMWEPLGAYHLFNYNYGLAPAMPFTSMHNDNQLRERAWETAFVTIFNALVARWERPRLKIEPRSKLVYETAPKSAGTTWYYTSRLKTRAALLNFNVSIHVSILKKKQTEATEWLWIHLCVYMRDTQILFISPLNINVAENSARNFHVTDTSWPS